MGQFSWRDCCDGSQIVNDINEDVYMLIPEEFGGGSFYEPCYDGYGRFAFHDVYEEVAIWNREFVKSNPHFLETVEAKYLRDENPEKIAEYLSDKSINLIEDLRVIGIIIACYDEDNKRLKYPIKITHDESAIYEEELYSSVDRNQGFIM